MKTTRCNHVSIQMHKNWIPTNEFVQNVSKLALRAKCCIAAVESNGFIHFHTLEEAGKVR